MRSLRRINAAHKFAWQVVAALVVVAVFLCVMTARGGEPVNLTVPHGLIELKMASQAPKGADVLWDVRTPIDASTRQYEGGSVFVSHTSELRQADGSFVPLIVILDVASYDRETDTLKRDRTRYTITVDGSTPPGPGPEPPPDPTIPPLTGVAGETYKRAKAINTPEVCLKVAGNFESVSSEIGAGAIQLPLEAWQRIDQLNRGLVPGNQQWRDLGSYFAGVVKGKPLPEVKTAFDQIALGLRKAGGQ